MTYPAEKRHEVLMHLPAKSPGEAALLERCGEAGFLRAQVPAATGRPLCLIEQQGAVLKPNKPKQFRLSGLLPASDAASFPHGCMPRLFFLRCPAPAMGPQAAGRWSRIGPPRPPPLPAVSRHDHRSRSAPGTGSSVSIGFTSSAAGGVRSASPGSPSVCRGSVLSAGEDARYSSAISLSFWTFLSPS